MTGQSPYGMNRRVFLAAAGAASTLAVAGCGSGEGSTPAPRPTRPAGPVLPDHIPYEEVTPDLPAGEHGIPAGFARIPEPAPTGRTPLPEIAPVSMLLQGNPPAIAWESNQFYGQLVADAGTSFDIAFGGYGEYSSKLQVTLAEGTLPEVVQLTPIAKMNDLLEVKFHNLAEFIAGDLVADFPSLAAIPTPQWERNVLDGALWGVSPSTPAVSGQLLLSRGDLLADRGLDPAPTLASGDDFLALLTELTGGNHFALADDPSSIVALLAQMHGAPNQWRKDGNTLVNINETPELKAAMESFIQIRDAGLIHPDALINTNPQMHWDVGTTALRLATISSWGSQARLHPDWTVRAVTTPQWSGGGAAAQHLDPTGTSAFVGISKDVAPDRVREILRVMDYIAAPLGTTEWMHVNYGVEGVHHRIQDGMPVVTQAAATESFPIGNLGSQVDGQLLAPGDEDTLTAQHEHLSAVLPEGMANAVHGHYSVTDNGQGRPAMVRLRDAQRQILLGHQPLSDWDGAVETWRASAGNKIRDEYLALID